MLKLCSAFYFDKYIFIMTWNARFKLRVLDSLEFCDWTSWCENRALAPARALTPSPPCFVFLCEGLVCVYVCVFTPQAAHSSSFLPSKRSHLATLRVACSALESGWGLFGAGVAEFLVPGAGSRRGREAWARSLSSVGSWRPHEKRVRKEVSLNCRLRERAPLLQH